MPSSRYSPAGVVSGSTATSADAGKTSASRQTFVSGNAARLAGEDLRAKILALANAGPDARLALHGTRLTISHGDAMRTIDLASLPAVIPEFRASEISGTQNPKHQPPLGPGSTRVRAPAGMTGDAVVLEGHGTWDPPTTPLDENGQGVPYATYGFAAQMAELMHHHAEQIDLARCTTIAAGQECFAGSEPGDDPMLGYVGVRWLGTGGVIDGLYSGVLLLAASGASGMLTGTAGMLPVAIG